MRELAHRSGRRPAGRARRLAAPVARSVGSTSAISAPSAAFEHDAALGALRDLDLALLEALADLEEDVVLAGLGEDRLPRRVQRAGQLLAFDHRARRQPALRRGSGLSK
jgi:hypothetical protein